MELLEIGVVVAATAIGVSVLPWRQHQLEEVMSAVEALKDLGVRLCRSLRL